MNLLLSEALTWLKAQTDNALGFAVAEVPVLSADALNLLENEVAPALDVPPQFIAAAKTENATIEAPVDAFAEAKLGLLKARVDALFPVAPSPSAAPAAKVA